MRMTKIFAMALAALTIASCSKEELGGSNNGTDGEEINTPTYATFKFNIGGPSSRAEDDAADADAVIGSLQLLIFNAATQGLEHNSTITENKETVLLTAGRKKIFVVANCDKLEDYNKAIDPTKVTPGTMTLTEFYDQNYSAITRNEAGEASVFDLSPLHTLSNETVGKEAGLPMSNTNEVTYTLEAGVSKEQAEGGTVTADGTSKTNTFSIQLHYMVAKARLVLAAKVESAGDFETKTPVIKEVKYSIRNLARITNYIQNVPTAGNPQSYYYSTKFAEAADKDKEVVAFKDEFDNASNISVTAAVKDATPAGNYLYVPENNHSMLSRGQSSYFAIKATFEPVVISKVEYDVNARVKYTHEELAKAKAGEETEATLDYIYTTNDVQGIPAGTYFLNVKLLQEAAWMMDNKIPFVEGTHRQDAEKLVAATDYMSFTDGFSYYRVDLGSGSGAATQYGVLRSNKYEATINKITGPGVPTEEDLITNPTNPVSAKTYISATIKTAVWTPITQSADL